jgi:putative Holliday junction resolvase
LIDSAELPPRGRLAGLDFGTVRIGIAVCDASQSICSPFDCYQRKTPALDGEYFCRLASSEHIVGFVIGLPVHMSGQSSQKSQEATEFGQWLTAQTQLPVCWIDERYTSALANEILAESGLSPRKRKEKLDKLAAQIILQAYLDSSRDGDNQTNRPIDDP